MDDTLQKSFEHAWKYFEIHANQRMQMFNYYIAISTAITAGLATSFQVGYKLSMLGIVMGLLLMLVSFIFSKLDARTSFLIKHAEQSLKKFELAVNSPDYFIFTLEENITHLNLTSNRCHIFTSWTYTKSFQFMFLILSLLGLGGAVISALIYFKII